MQHEVDTTVDVAIVTTLQVERDAVIARLDTYEEVRPEGEARTYYLGSISIPGRDEQYRVVVVMLLDMGNDEAAVETTRLLTRWKPENVLIVGIAGGVKGRVSLGDVVVSQFSFYYEAGKITTDGSEVRGRQFASDYLLYGRALDHREVVWKSDIGVVPPPEAEREDFPSVHFGPIASGEKIIADDQMMTLLLQQCPKLLAVAMEGAGVGRACAHESPSPRFLEIRGICDFADSQKNDSWQRFAAHAAAAFAYGLLRSRPIPPLSSRLSVNAEGFPLVLLRAQSLAAISDVPAVDMDSHLLGRDVQLFPLDFTDLVPRAQGLTNPAEAVRRLLDPKGSLFGALARQGEAELAFHGLVHIPLAVLAGHIVSDRQPVRLFDYHPDVGAGTWTWPSVKSEGFPELNVGVLPDEPLLGKGAAVMRISVSYPVTIEQTLAAVPNRIIDVDGCIANPARGLIRSEAQTREYGRVVRQVLDAIARHSGVDRIHLFYAGPVSLAFHLGQQVLSAQHLARSEHCE